MTTTPRRLGLVVATTEYDDSRLSRLGAPLADALELARTLTDQGGFEVETLINAEAQTVQRRIERFCKSGRRHTDVLFVYLTGHGVKDDDGNLYFALRDTDRDLLRTTALSADLLAAVLDESPARSQVLMLDCCYSGAIARALRPKGDEDPAGLAETFGSSGGRGRVVLAASSAIEPAWEGDSGSIYTRGVVEGIRTGAADLDGDGRITARELHTHVAGLLNKEGRQSPRKFEFDDAGDLVIARPGNQPMPTSPPVPKRQGSAPAGPGWTRFGWASAIGPTADSSHGSNPCAKAQGAATPTKGPGLDSGNGGGGLGNAPRNPVADRCHRISSIALCNNHHPGGDRPDDDANHQHLG